MTHFDEAQAPAVADVVRHEAHGWQPISHHGRTKAAWAGSVIAAIGFLLSTVGFLMDISWPVVWAGLAIVVVGAIAGLIMRNIGLGQRVG